MPEVLAPANVLVLVLVFVRASATLLVAPLFGHRAIPVMHRVALGFALALVLAPAAPPRTLAEPLAVVLACAGEAIVGLAIGAVAALFLAAVQSAGELLGFQMALAVASAWDPGLGRDTNPLTRLYDTLALLLFLGIDGHHVVIQALAASVRAVPTGALAVGAAGGLVELGGRVVQAGLEIAAPVAGVLFVANGLLALSARVAPQMNVFGAGVPITLAVGFFAALESLPYVTGVLTRLCGDLGADLGRVFGGWRGV
jgi:flagellar biosynthetic protein FliR